MAGRDVHRFDEKESEKAPGFGGIGREKEREREKNDIKKEDRASVREERHRRGNLQNGGGEGDRFEEK